MGKTIVSNQQSRVRALPKRGRSNTRRKKRSPIYTFEPLSCEHIKPLWNFDLLPDYQQRNILEQLEELVLATKVWLPDTLLEFPEETDVHAMWKHIEELHQKAKTAKYVNYIRDPLKGSGMAIVEYDDNMFNDHDLEEKGVAIDISDISRIIDSVLQDGLYQFISYVYNSLGCSFDFINNMFYESSLDYMVNNLEESAEEMDKEYIDSLSTTIEAYQGPIRDLLVSIIDLKPTLATILDIRHHVPQPVADWMMEFIDMQSKYKMDIGKYNFVPDKAEHEYDGDPITFFHMTGFYYFNRLVQEQVDEFTTNSFNEYGCVDPFNHGIYNKDYKIDYTQEVWPIQLKEWFAKSVNLLNSKDSPIWHLFETSTSNYCQDLTLPDTALINHIQNMSKSRSSKMANWQQNARL